MAFDTLIQSIEHPSHAFVNSNRLTTNAFTCPACKAARSVKHKRKVWINDEPIFICSTCFASDPVAVMAALKE